MINGGRKWAGEEATGGLGVPSDDYINLHQNWAGHKDWWKENLSEFMLKAGREENKFIVKTDIDLHLQRAYKDILWGEKSRNWKIFISKHYFNNSKASKLPIKKCMRKIAVNWNRTGKVK